LQGPRESGVGPLGHTKLSAAGVIALLPHVDAKTDVDALIVALGGESPKAKAAQSPKDRASQSWERAFAKLGWT